MTQFFSKLNNRLPKDTAKLHERYDVVTGVASNAAVAQTMQRSGTTNKLRADIRANMQQTASLFKRKCAAPSRVESEMVARSWVRTLAVERGRVARFPHAQEKLRGMPEATLRRAADHALKLKTVTTSYFGYGSLLPVDRLAQLQKTLYFDREGLAEAVKFKLWLDEEFKKGKNAVEVKQKFSNSQVFVILQLVNHERLRLVPKRPPINFDVTYKGPRTTPWGFGNGHYQIKRVDKGWHFWGVFVEPTERYLYGLPTQAAVLKTPAPTVKKDKPGRPIPTPYWVDFEEEVIPSRWRQIATLLAQLPAARAGMSTAHISSLTRFTLEEWEIDMACKWLSRVGAVEVNHDGYPMIKSGEWWWVAAATIHEKWAAVDVEGNAQIVSETDMFTGLQEAWKPSTGKKRYIGALGRLVRRDLDDDEEDEDDHEHQEAEDEVEKEVKKTNEVMAT